MRPRSVALFVAIVIVISACGIAGEPAATSTSLPTDTPLVPPTLTATPTIPLAILVLPADLDPDTSNLYQKTVYDLAQAAGFRFQVRNTLTPADIEPGLKVVIALPPDPGIAALAAAAPQAQFLAIDIPGLTAGGNLSVLANNSQSVISAFLAGYTAALITDDYRIGMIIPKDNPEALNALNAFTDGMASHCGTCKPVFYPPFCTAENLARCYPQYIEIPSDEDKSRYGPYADYLIIQRKVKTIYVYPDIATTDLLTYIGTTGTSMIGTTTPEQRPAGWVMTIQPNVINAIQNAWPSLISGKGGNTVQSPLGIGDIDPGLLSTGKQRLVEQTLRDLQSGFIGP